MFSISVLPLVCIVAVFMTEASGYNRDHDCFVGRMYYRHNQLFSLPNQSHCIKYICWYGRVVKRIEACEVDGECHRVGSSFEHRCTRYRCNKINRGHLTYYQPDIVSTRCRDFNGVCRRPGETFPFQMHGRYYDTCTCTTAHTSIRYRCTSYQHPRLVSGSRGPASNGDTGTPIVIGGRASVSGGPGSRGHYTIRGGPGEDDSEVSISISAMGAQN